MISRRGERILIRMLVMYMSLCIKLYSIRMSRRIFDRQLIYSNRLVVFLPILANKTIDAPYKT